jgi:hypothetical protein
MTHYLVTDDTNTSVKLSLVRQDTGLPVDCSTSTVVLKFRKRGTKIILFNLTGEIAAGSPTNEITFSFANNLINLAPGLYEGEIEVTDNTSNIESVYEVLKFQVREDF